MRTSALQRILAWRSWPSHDYVILTIHAYVIVTNNASVPFGIWQLFVYMRLSRYRRGWSTYVTIFRVPIQHECAGDDSNCIHNLTMTYLCVVSLNGSFVRRFIMELMTLRHVHRCAAHSKANIVMVTSARCCLAPLHSHYSWCQLTWISVN